MDSTFKVVPKSFYQLLTIHCADIQTGTIVSIAHILMSSKSEVLYRLVFEQLLNI